MPRLYMNWARRKVRAERRAGSNAAEGGKVVKQIQAEAKKAGATLANGGKGGLDPKLALEVFRRDKWRCQNKSCPSPKKDLDLDHISGHAKEIKDDPGARKDPKLKKGVQLGHVNKPEALHVLCAKCHDTVHNRERAIEDDKKPPPVRGE